MADAVLHARHVQRVCWSPQVVLLAQVQQPTQLATAVLLKKGADASLAEVPSTETLKGTPGVNLGVREEEIGVSAIASAYALEVNDQQLPAAPVKGEMREGLSDLRVLAVVRLIDKPGVRVELDKVALQPGLPAEVVSVLSLADRRIQLAVEEAKLHPRRHLLRECPELAGIELGNGRRLAKGHVRLETPILLEVLKEPLGAHHVLHGVRGVHARFEDHAVNQAHAALHEGLAAEEDPLHCSCPVESATVEPEGRLRGHEVLPEVGVPQVLEDAARVRQLELHGVRGPFGEPRPRRHVHGPGVVVVFGAANLVDGPVVAVRVRGGGPGAEVRDLVLQRPPPDRAPPPD
mmetsp:Transcript_55443/g.172395  ORF Transcript_55443/g.172395 Transcript_55443/m.172395 type:complete len:348 (+) Transcript_55443:200-1243(+)